MEPQMAAAGRALLNDQSVDPSPNGRNGKKGNALWFSPRPLDEGKGVPPAKHSALLRPSAVPCPLHSPTRTQATSHAAPFITASSREPPGWNRLPPPTRSPAF